LPSVFKDIIEYDNPRTLEEVMRKENFCYGQNKNRREVVPSLKNKNTNTFEQRRGNFKPNKNFNNINFQKGSYQGNNF